MFQLTSFSRCFLVPRLQWCLIQFFVCFESFISVEYLIGQNFGEQKCRKYDLLPKILSAEKFCPPKICPIRTILNSLPSSLNTMESVCTLSQNLYVSQHTRTGTLLAFATIATIADPVLAMTLPFERRAWAPRNTTVTCEERTYYHHCCLGFNNIVSTD